MKTPKSTSRGRLSRGKPTPLVAVHPWADAKSPAPHPGAHSRNTPVRAEARALARELYPNGKALARVRYFEAQRGMGSVVPPGVHLARGKEKGAAAASPRNVKFPYAKAFAAKMRMKPTFAAAATLPVWRELGPTLIPHGQSYGSGPGSQPPVSGRCVGIDIDPANRRHVVLCSAGGGLWDSFDAGATWRPLTDRQPTLAMGAIARSPSSPNVLYAATGEGDGQVPFCVGLLRSTDGGLTWTHVHTAILVGEAIYDLVVHPSDPQHVWIGGTRGFYESTDGGATVQRVSTAQTWDISINPANPAEMFVATAAGLRLSKNGGSSWSTVMLPGVAAGAAFDRIEVCHAPSNPAAVYVAAYVSGAKGASLWRRATATGSFSVEKAPSAMDTSQAWYDWCLAVAPNDPDTVIWGAIELYRGKRGVGGFKWTDISSRKTGDSIHPDQHHVAFDPSDGKTLYACNDGGVFVSADIGNTWKSLNPGLGITEFEFLAQLESDSAWIMGGTQDNGTLGNPGALRWDQVALGDGGDCGAVDGAAPTCFHSYYGMWIERAAAKGAQAFKWKNVSPPSAKNYPALFYPPMDVLGDTVVKAGSTVFISADAGETWIELALPTSSAAQPDLVSAVTLVAEDTILIGTAKGRAYRIRRGTHDWTGGQVQPLASPRAGYLSDIIVGSKADTLWCACSTLNGAHVFRSTDGGATWTDRSANLPPLPANALVIDPADGRVVYVATDMGVYKTADEGDTWTEFSNGLPNVLVGDLILHATKRMLRAGTKNRGAWEVSI